MVLLARTNFLFTSMGLGGTQLGGRRVRHADDYRTTPALQHCAVGRLPFNWCCGLEPREMTIPLKHASKPRAQARQFLSALKWRWSIYHYLGVGLALAVGAILMVSTIASQRENDSSRATQETVVRFETEHLLNALADKLTTMIYWQDAYDKVAKSWDKKWVDYQFGPYLDAININVVAIFDAKGHLLFRYVHALKKPPSQVGMATNPNLGELVAATLKRKSLRPPHIETATVDIDGTPYFAVSGLITPESDAQMPIPVTNKRVVVFLTRASASSYATLSESFGVSGIQVASNIPDRNGYASVALKDANGDVATHVWWRPMRPGVMLLRILVPLSVLVFFLLAAVQAMIVRRWQALQHALFKSQAKSESVEEESRAKSAFLGTISHELRTPLNAVIGFSNVLLREMSGANGSPQQREYAEYIREAGHSLLAKVNDLIEIARIESHETALERVPTNAEELANDAIENLRDAAEQKNVAITFSAGAQALWCLAAPLGLRQVMIRILDNAIKFSEPGGTVEIGTACDHENLVIKICDHGIGIECEYLERLGKPFVQVEGFLARRNEGVGLGLAISKGLMKLMEGSLEVSSEFGAGATVTLRLPTLPSQSVQQRAA
jgi:signal transduction histidine kinase